MFYSTFIILFSSFVVSPGWEMFSKIGFLQCWMRKQTFTSVTSNYKVLVWRGGGRLSSVTNQKPLIKNVVGRKNEIFWFFYCFLEMFVNPFSEILANQRFSWALSLSNIFVLVFSQPMETLLISDTSGNFTRYLVPLVQVDYTFLCWYYHN